MRAFKRAQERDYDRTRLVLFEMINGNPNIKKNSKPKTLQDLFFLPSIDVKIELKPTRVTSKQAKEVEKMGYKIPECFIKD